jgi:hypothetical protein
MKNVFITELQTMQTPYKGSNIIQVQNMYKSWQAPRRILLNTRTIIINSKRVPGFTEKMWDANSAT